MFDKDPLEVLGFEDDIAVSLDAAPFTNVDLKPIRSGCPICNTLPEGQWHGVLGFDEDQQRSAGAIVNNADSVAVLSNDIGDTPSAS